MRFSPVGADFFVRLAILLYNKTRKKQTDCIRKFFHPAAFPAFFCRKRGGQPEIARNNARGNSTPFVASAGIQTAGRGAEGKDGADLPRKSSCGVCGNAYVQKCGCIQEECGRISAECGHRVVTTADWDFPPAKRSCPRSGRNRSSAFS